VTPTPHTVAWIDYR